MSENSVLNEATTKVANFVRAWRSKYERNFDLQVTEQQALFYEGMLELARFLAVTSDHSSINCELCSKGFSEVKISVTPSASLSKPSDSSQP